MGVVHDASAISPAFTRSGRVLPRLPGGIPLPTLLGYTQLCIGVPKKQKKKKGKAVLCRQLGRILIPDPQSPSSQEKRVSQQLASRPQQNLKKRGEAYCPPNHAASSLTYLGT